MAAKELIISEELIVTNINVQGKKEIITRLASLLYEKGYVTNDYIDAVLEREKNYPTGLPSKEIGVAIPHADIKYVKKPGIAIAALNNPVTFSIMGNPDEKVNVDVVFMLAIKEPKMQIKMLKNLMAIIQKVEVLKKIKKSKHSREIVEIIEKELDKLKKSA